MSNRLMDRYMVANSCALRVGESDRFRDGLVAIPSNALARARGHSIDGPVILDLFAGAGGFGLGFRLAGARVKAAIEIDEWACETLRANHPEAEVVEEDVTKVSDDDLAALGQGVDIIIGGPPCQGFSVANVRAKDEYDPRNSLFREFVRAVELCRPRALLMENVPGLLKRRTATGEHVINVIVGEIQRLGYAPYVSVLQAMDFGVPQIRPRLFVLGLLRQSSRPFPLPTHTGGTPVGNSLFGNLHDCRSPVTVWEAISDLPQIEARQGDEVMDYDVEPENSYQALLRTDSSKVYNHVAMRHSARMVDRFTRVKWGESGADVPSEHGARVRGNPNELSARGYDQNNRRMFPNRPCHTIPASFYANFIHPFLHRNFTPREGARLQSFPDWYRFFGKPTVVSQRLLGREGRHSELHLCQYNQIGNAVPPLLAYKIANHLFAHL